jgi:hypothetical protein
MDEETAYVHTWYQELKLVNPHPSKWEKTTPQSKGGLVCSGFLTPLGQIEAHGKIW